MEIVTLVPCQTCGANPDWRRVTITAASRLASRVNSRALGALRHEKLNGHFQRPGSCLQKRNMGTETAYGK